VPFKVGLRGVIAQGMNEIAHNAEIVCELASPDREANHDHQDNAGE
jgi:hypothetical protein